MLVKHFPIGKITNHSTFVQFFVLMELHEKCLIIIFSNMEIEFWSNREEHYIQRASHIAKQCSREVSKNLYKRI